MAFKLSQLEEIERGNISVYGAGEIEGRKIFGQEPRDAEYNKQFRILNRSRVKLNR